MFGVSVWVLGLICKKFKKRGKNEVLQRCKGGGLGARGGPREAKI